MQFSHLNDNGAAPATVPRCTGLAATLCGTRVGPQVDTQLQPPPAVVGTAKLPFSSVRVSRSHYDLRYYACPVIGIGVCTITVRCPLRKRRMQAGSGRMPCICTDRCSFHVQFLLLLLLPLLLSLSHSRASKPPLISPSTGRMNRSPLHLARANLVPPTP